MVDIAAFPPRSVAGIASFRDRARLLAALQAEFGAAVPTTARAVQAGPVTIACLAPGRFLATGDAGARLPVKLAGRLDGLAAVTDQSDMWAGWRVCGEQVRTLLARIVPVDLAPAVFQVGDLALTRAGHMDVRVWRLGTDAYEIAVTRSLADDLLYALESGLRAL